MWRLIWRYGTSVLLDVVLGLITGSGIWFAVVYGLLEFIVLDTLIPGLTFWEVEAIGAAVNETEHAIAAAYDYEEQSEREREAQARELNREGFHTPFLFGDFSVADAGLLAASAYKVSTIELPETAFQVVTGLLDLL